MPGWLLNLLYAAALVVATPWLLFARVARGKRRGGWREKLLGLTPIRTGDAPCVWLHAVSVGEVNLLAPLVARLAARHPHWRIVITATTVAGFELARRKYSPQLVCYAPLDFTWAVRRAMARLRPRLVVLAELEIWPNLVREARRRGARVAVVNGRLSDRSLRGYRRLAWLLRDSFASLDLVAAQNDEYAERFRALGVPAERVTVTGSLKFDGAETDRGNPRTRQLAHLAGVADDDLVLLAGSTQEPEEALALEAYRDLCEAFPRLRLIVTPRHPERFESVAALLARSGLAWSRRSQLVAGGPPAERVLLVDAVGELGAWWGLAHIAYVGGSLGPREGQNMIEPAAYGAAVSFGPRTKNFRDVVRLLLAADGAVVVRDGAELTAFVRRALADPAWRIALGERARRLVQSQLGAADVTLALLDRLLDEPNLSRRAA